MTDSQGLGEREAARYKARHYYRTAIEAEEQRGMKKGNPDRALLARLYRELSELLPGTASGFAVVGENDSMKVSGSLDPAAVEQAAVKLREMLRRRIGTPAGPAKATREEFVDRYRNQKRWVHNATGQQCIVLGYMKTADSRALYDIDVAYFNHPGTNVCRDNGVYSEEDFLNQHHPLRGDE